MSGIKLMNWKASGSGSSVSVTAWMMENVALAEFATGQSNIGRGVQKTLATYHEYKFAISNAKSTKTKDGWQTQVRCPKTKKFVTIVMTLDNRIKNSNYDVQSPTELKKIFGS